MEWSNWTNKMWEKIIFSDETKINLFSSDGRIKVWRKSKKRLSLENCVPTVKFFGGSVMVWGCMSYKGVGKLVFIEETMDRFVYKKILAENLKSSCDIFGFSEDFIFQQDNDPKHKSKYVNEFFDAN